MDSISKHIVDEAIGSTTEIGFAALATAVGFPQFALAAPLAKGMILGLWENCYNDYKQRTLSVAEEKKTNTKSYYSITNKNPSNNNNINNDFKKRAEKLQYLDHNKKVDLRDSNQRNEYVNDIKGKIQNFSNTKKEKENNYKNIKSPFDDINEMLESFKNKRNKENKNEENKQE